MPRSEPDQSGPSGGPDANTVPLVQEIRCTGCDVCVEICPDVFEMNDELVAEVVNPLGDTREAIQEAIDLCPESCIVWS